MNGQKEKVSEEAIYQNLMMIWFALFMSQFLFLVMIYFVEPRVFEFDLTKPVLDQNSMIVIIFAVVGVFNFGLSFLLKKKFIDQAITEQNVSYVQTAMIAGCALCETVTLFGMMLAFVAGYQYFFAWFILGTLGMLFHFPKRDNVIAATFKKGQL